MKIKAIKFREGGFATQPFAFGGEEGQDKFDKSIRYRSGLTNYLIDTGKEVILDRIREFVSKNPTVYLSTHTPQGAENLDAKRVVDLKNPPKTIPAGDVVFKTKSGKYVCSVCGYVYDPKEHDNIPFEKLPSDWKCPRCKRGKGVFNNA